MCCCSSSFFVICHFPCFHICRSNNCSKCPICFTYHITVKIGDLNSREDGVFKWDLLTWETTPSQFTFREAIIIYYYYLKNNVQIGRQRLYMYKCVYYMMIMKYCLCNEEKGPCVKLFLVQSSYHENKSMHHI